MAKILLIDEHKTVNYAGGVERVLAAFANAFSSRGYDVAIACMDDEKGKMFFPLDSSVRFHNLWYEFGKSFGGVSWFLKKVEKEFLRTFAGAKMVIAGKQIKDPKKEYYFRSFIGRLNKLMEDFRPDVILAITAESAYMAQMACGDNPVPVIAMCHTEPQREASGYGEREYNAWRNSARVQVLMNSFVPWMEKLGVRNIVRIPNYVEQTPDNKTADLMTSKNKIVTVGRIDGAGKSQHILIEAFALLAKEFPEWSVHIYGEIANRRYKKRLDAMISEKKLAGRVTFEGTTKDISAVYRGADIFAFPSGFEGFGLALAEAMSAGLPAVGRKSCVAVNELIRDGETGVLVEEGIENFSQALEHLMSNSTLRVRMGAAAHEVAKAYEPDKVWAMWESVIQEVIHEYGVSREKG